MTVLLLGIDTATAVGSLALVRVGAVLGRRTIAASATHSAELGPALDGLLEECDARLDEVGAIGVGRGPGSYTGLRVGIAFAKGLEFGLRVPLIGVPSFEAIAFACRDLAAESTICALVDAKMGGIYAGLYRLRGEAVDVVREPWVSPADEFVLEADGPVVFAGPDEMVMTKLGASFEGAPFQQAYPDAAYTARRAGELLAQQPADERFASIEPFYLRPSFAELTRESKKKEK